MEGICLPGPPPAPPSAAFVESKMGGGKAARSPPHLSQCTSTVRLWKEGILFVACHNLLCRVVPWGSWHLKRPAFPEELGGSVWLVFLKDELMRTQIQRLTAVP